MAWSAERHARGLVLPAAIAAMVIPLGTVGMASAATSAPPGITHLTPAHGLTSGGTKLTVSGARFSHVRSVTIGSTKARLVRVISATRLVVTTPRHAAGLVNVRVRTSSGISPVTRADHFRYVAPLAMSTSVGNDSACAVTSAGGVDCWGGNEFGDLGEGQNTYLSLIPKPVVGLSSGVRQVSAGQGWSTCAVTNAGAVKCWGNNAQGALGDGGSEPLSTTPVTVTGLSDVRQVGVGNGYACALTNPGAVKCWGANASGQLGNGSSAPMSRLPVAVSGLSSGVTAITVGPQEACALTAGGGVQCWGGNGIGQLGDGGLEQFSKTPVPVTGLSSGVTSISANGSGVCAVTTAGALMCWGEIYNLVDHLVFGAGLFAKPTQVFGLAAGVRSVALGTDSSCLTTTAGALQCWGSDARGSLGDGKSGNGGIGLDAQNPVAVPALSSGVVQTSVGFMASCAITTSSALYCWGRNVGGIVGTGTQDDVPTPTAIHLV